ncbi:hypothetical protein [Pseudogemmobacter sonorensis]|uniref:hypothetical protein n=1 Tax=Pseudogemmobacter sonorensis TaxID=2989681 RepID=UPI0036B20BD3
MSVEFPITKVPTEVLEAMKNIRRGPKNSKRLAELDALASAAIDRGDAANIREAAKLFLSEYGNEGYDPDHRNNRLADIAKRIKKFRTQRDE